jgi:hypothetical protein
VLLALEVSDASPSLLDLEAEFSDHRRGGWNPRESMLAQPRKRTTPFIATGGWCEAGAGSEEREA